MKREPPEIVDPCFLALTRPVMFAGVPMETFAVVGMVGVLGLILVGLKSVGFAFVVFWFSRVIVRYDHNQFFIWAVWLATRARQKNGSYWGGSTVSPGRVVASYSEKDFGNV